MLLLFCMSLLFMLFVYIDALYVFMLFPLIIKSEVVYISCLSLQYASYTFSYSE